MFWEVADFINILGIVVNIILIIFVSNRIQNNINNTRFFKDYTINELKSLKERSCKFLTDLESENLNTRIITSNFISIINEHDALNQILEKAYEIRFLNQISLKIISFQMLVEDDATFVSAYLSNNNWQVTDQINQALHDLRGEIMSEIHELNYSINNK